MISREEEIIKEAYRLTDLALNNEEKIWPMDYLAKFFEMYITLLDK